MKIRAGKKTIIAVIAFLIIIISANVLVSRIVEKKLTDFILNTESKYYVADVENIDFNLFRRTFLAKKLSITPKTLEIDSLKLGESKKNELEEITLASIELKGIGILRALWSSKIHIEELDINGLHIKAIKNEKIEKESTKKVPFDLDSIYIKKLNGFQLNRINVNDFVYESVDSESNETLLKNEPISFKTGGIKFEKIGDHFFKLLPVDDSFKISNINLSFNKIQYNISIGAIDLNFIDKIVSIENFQLSPQIEKEKLAKTYKYTTDVNTVTVKDFKIYNFNLQKFIKNKDILIDSLQVKGLDANLYKDKNLPFNTNRYKQLPHIALQKMQSNLHISKVSVIDSRLVIQEKLADRDSVMMVSFDDLNLSITNIASLKEKRKDPMLVEINALLMKEAPLTAHLVFPLEDNMQSITFNGKLGAAKLSWFDTAIYPSTGLKVLHGNLNSMVFSATLNNHESNGSMTMLYSDLEARVFKKNSLERNDFLSWTLNNLIKGSNPKKNHDVRVAVMKSERVTYKGLGGYLWKTILSGIVNTIAPGGKEVKPPKKEKRKRVNQKEKTDSSIKKVAFL